MKVRYRANGELADLSDEAARHLITAGICEPVDDAPSAPVAPMTTDSMPVRPKRAR